MKGESHPRSLKVSLRRFALVVAVGLTMLATLRGSAAVLTVSTTAASGPGSLQQAILDANATNGLDSIVFHIPGDGVHTITPANPLPPITDSVVIDGTTQDGFTGTPLIELNGSSAGTGDGLQLSAGNSTIRGLIINRFGGAGVHLQAPGGNNVVEGNRIGTDSTGASGLGNGQSAKAGGVWIDGSSGNLVGGLHSTNRNLISANTGSGIYVQNSTGNTIQGNLIGVSLSGAAALGNTSDGISLYNSGTNQVGGASAAARNVLSGNGGNGVWLNGARATGNVIEGNYLGTDTTGALPIPNAGDGVTLLSAAANTVGGTDAGAGNVLSANTQNGVGIKGAGADSNVVQGNYIGTDASGRVALGNAVCGITIFGGNSNLVGGVASAAGNVICANKLSGINLTTNSTGNLVQGNLIGVDATGAATLGNAVNGLSIVSAGLNTIGGATTAARNVISGNTSYGMEIFGPGATGNLVQGNYIGTAANGQSALANKLCGVHIQSPGNAIGGSAAGAGNLVSGNGQDGIFLDGAGAANNTLQGNLIGTAAGGTAGLMNVHGGVGISGAPANVIGGTTPGAGNLISANASFSGDAGIYLIGSGATGNVIQGNKLGTDITGNLPLGNTHEGIYLERAPTNTIGGPAPGAGNLISANLTRGIYLVNAPGNVIQGNLIGTAQDGISGLGNTFHSVECEAGSCNTLIGGAGTAGNRIAFTKTIYAGVRIRDGSTNNAILGNAIFANGALGIDLGPAGTNAIVACGAGTGANMGQNYPVLTQAVSGNGTGVRGTLNSRPNQSFLLQFFANPACDSSGCGEGQIYLGQQTVVTGSDCHAPFAVALPVQVPIGYAVTATATDSANNTSEFSACIAVESVPALSVSPADSGQVTLAWTNTATGFLLKQTDSLSPPVQWITVTNSIVPSNGQFTVTVSAATGSHFFALRFE